MSINIEDITSWVVTLFILLLIYVCFTLIKKSIRYINHNEIAAIPLLFKRRSSKDEDEIINYRVQKGGFFFLPFYIPSSAVTILSSDIIKLSVKCSGMITKDMVTTITADTILLFYINFSSENSQRKAFDAFGKLSTRDKKFQNDICEMLEESIAAATRAIVGGLDITTLTTNITEFDKIAFSSINDSFSEMGLAINSLKLLNVRVTNKDYEVYRDKKNAEIQEREYQEEKGRTEEVQQKTKIKILKLKDEEAEENLKIKQKDVDRDLSLVTKQVNKEKAIRQIELAKESNIKELEANNKIHLKQLELQYEQEELKSQHQKTLQEEDYRILIAQKKVGRIDVEKDVLDKEEAHNLKNILADERARAEADRIIHILQANKDKEVAAINLEKSKTDDQIAYYDDLTKKRAEEIIIDLIYKKLSAEAHGQDEMNQAMNKSNSLTVLNHLLKENPELISNIVEKALGKKGLSGVMQGLTQHLAGIDSIRIADLGSTNSEKSGLEKFIDLPLKSLTEKLLPTLNALNIAPNLIKKFTSEEGSFDNLGKSESTYKKAFNDSDSKEKDNKNKDD